MTSGGANSLAPCQSFNRVRGQWSAARKERGARGSEV